MEIHRRVTFNHGAVFTILYLTTKGGNATQIFPTLVFKNTMDLYTAHHFRASTFASDGSQLTPPLHANSNTTHTQGTISTSDVAATAVELGLLLLLAMA